jgi:hypothetical protein
MMFIGTLGAIANGSMIQLNLLIFSSIIDTFSDYSYSDCGNTTSISNETSNSTFDLTGKMNQLAVDYSCKRT